MALTTNSPKSRNLTFHELFEVLQREYIVCEVRIHIYPEVVTNKLGQEIRLKDYWRNTASKKKEKILDIARRNSFPCIFDDSRIKDSYNKKILNPIGYPNFIYKDSTQQLMQEKWDLHNYYKEFTDVKVLNERGAEVLGHICTVDFVNKTADVKLKDKDEVKTFDFDIITRIINL